MIMNKPLWGQDTWKDFGVCVQEPEALLPVFHIPAHKALTHSGNRKADAEAQVPARATDPSVHTAD